MANYLYNGVELPDINEVWTDKETYPYAFVCRVETEDDEGKAEGVMILLSDTKGEFNDLAQTHMIPQPFNYCMYGLDGNDYKYAVSGTMDVAFPLHGEGYTTLLWASHDICRTVWNGNNYVETDEVMFAASDPILVSIPTPSPDPTSMYLGWLVGRRITGLRKIKVIRDAELIDAELIDGVLYIKNAPNAILNGNTLEVI